MAAPVKQLARDFPGRPALLAGLVSLEQFSAV
jgi:hypothetical protein